MDIKVIVILLLTALSFTRCSHLILGDPYKNRLTLYHTVARYHAIPFTKRVKNVFFNSENLVLIDSIFVYDNLHSLATATVTAGGIGFTYVNLRLKSERGRGLDFNIDVYAN